MSSVNKKGLQMDPRILKIGRIILIPIFLFLLVSAYGDMRNIYITSVGRKIFERSLTEKWPTTFATFDKAFVLWHEKPYKKGMPMNVLPNYSYRVGSVVCKSNRFEFGPRKTDYTEIPVGDRRLNDMIKQYCPGKPLKTEKKDIVQYDYQCYPVAVFYDPQNVCLSYIAQPLNPEAVRYALKKNMVLFVLMAFVKLILAAACIYGVLPVLQTFKRRIGTVRTK